MKLEYRYGLYAALGLVAWELGEWALGLHGKHIAWQPDAGVLSLIVPAFFIYLGLRTKRDVVQQGYMGLKEGLQSAFWMTVVYTVFSTLFMAIYLSWVNPGYLDRRNTHLMERRIEQLQRAPEVSETQARRLAEEAIGSPDTFKALLSYGTVRVSQGILLGLVVTLLLRRERPFAQQEFPSATSSTEGPHSGSDK